MADLDSCRRTNFSSGSRKGSQCPSWIWCIIIQCILSLPCIFSECLDVNISVAIYPKGDINIRFGDPLEIFCIAEDYSSNDIQFIVGSEQVASEIINSTTRRLYIQKPEKQSITYYCKNNKTGTICTSRVLVETPPSDVTEFKCLSKNLDTLNCSWTSPESYTNIQYNLSFSVYGEFVNPCVAQKVKYTLIRYCVWNKRSQPRYRHQDDELVFYLRACNVFDCKSQSFTIDHFSIVKPDPPSDLKVLKHGTHSVVLKWSIPDNIVDLLRCGVEHIIEYQIAKVDDPTHFRRVNTSNLPLRNKTYKYNLTDLPYAHMRYEVRVYIKSKKAKSSEFWSDYSFIFFTTYGERPERPPKIIAGAFDQVIFNDKRVINVYWKQLEEYEEAGTDFSYKILVTQNNKTQIQFTEINKKINYATIDTTLGELDVSVWSSNVNGTSVDSSYIYIPPEPKTHELKVISFTKHEYENGTYELSWVGNPNVDNYTLFWCRQNKRQLCGDGFEFVVLDPTETNHVIDLPMENSYQFAISANKGSDSSGMYWPKCEISRNKFVMSQFVMQLKYDSIDTSLTLKWVLDCAFNNDIITGYNISYCPIVGTSNKCDYSDENGYLYINNPKQTSVTITNILPSRIYKYTFVLDTIYGKKNIVMNNVTI